MYRGLVHRLLGNRPIGGEGTGHYLSDHYGVAATVDI
jgi:hypothetical protein